MLRTFFVVSTLCLFAVSKLNAKILRVGIDYDNFLAAHDAAAPGDTLQIYGVHSGIVTKRLVIMGFGYNFDVHPNLQVIDTDAPSMVSITFGSGSDGSIAIGLSGDFIIGDQSGNGTPLSNITFSRCKGNFTFYNYELYSRISNIKILSSVIESCRMLWNDVNDHPVINLQVYNCIIHPGPFILYKVGTSASIINSVTASTAIVGGSFLSLNDASVLIKNCILSNSGASTNINTVFENNIFEEAQPTQLPPGSNNHWNQNWSIIFNGVGANENASYIFSTEFDENYYLLKAGSPAVNAGLNAANAATDCGIFGGEPVYMYKVSGLPAVPSIYKLSAPGSAATSNPYNVTISVKSNN